MTADIGSTRLKQRGLELRLLGAVEVVGRGGAAHLAGSRPKAALAVLALQAGRLVTADRLIEAVWGANPPETARNALQVHISRLRTAIGEVAGPAGKRWGLEGSAAGYVLLVAPDQVDALQFEALSGKASVALMRGKADQAESMMVEALGLWRGSALTGVQDAPFAASEMTRLDEARLSLYESYTDVRLGLGRPAEVIADLERLVGENPYREGLWRRLILALYRAGRQADALSAFRRIQALLSDELGIDPGPDLAALEVAILHQDPGLIGPQRRDTEDLTTASEGLAPERAPLPFYPNPIVGRLDELIAVGEILADRDVRMLTILGPGGTGKTRLAVEAAGRAATDFPGGVVFVDLAPVETAEAILDLITQAFGGQPRDNPLTLLPFAVGEQPALVLLDNAEHLAAASGPLLTAALGACASLTLLVTSRIAVGIAAEHRFPLQPLPIEDAVELFSRRARAWIPRFKLNEGTETVVRRICEGVDRLPLAIDLAAARLRLQPLAAVDAQVQRNALELSGGRDAPNRQQTLRATVKWSVDLLSTPSRDLLGRLSVFEAGFTLDAAQAVGEVDELATLEILGELVDSSLVVGPSTEEALSAGDVPRFRLLETIRQFAAELLRASGQSEQAHSRHALYFGQLFTTADAIADPTGVVLDADIANLGTALSRLGDEDPKAAFELYATTYPRLLMTGYLRELESWGARLRPRVVGLGAHAQLDALAGVGAYHAGARDKARGLLLPALDTLLELGVDTYAAVLGCNYAAGAMIEQGDVARATFFSNFGVDVAARTGDDGLIALAAQSASYVARMSGATELALELCRASLALARRAGDGRTVVHELCSLSYELVSAGQPLEGLKWAREGLDIARGLGKFTLGLAFASNAVGRSLVALGRTEEAVEPLLRAFVLQQSAGFEPENVGWLAVAVATINPDAGARILGAAEALAEHDPDVLPPEPLLREIRKDLENKHAEAIADGRALGWMGISDLLTSLHSDAARPSKPSDQPSRTNADDA